MHLFIYEHVPDERKTARIHYKQWGQVTMMRQLIYLASNCPPPDWENSLINIDRSLGVTVHRTHFSLPKRKHKHTKLFSQDVTVSCDSNISQTK